MPREVILLASSRKGTHLVLTSLAQHPEVYAYRQMLQVPDFYPTDLGADLLDRFCEAVERDDSNPFPPAWSQARTNLDGIDAIVIPACWFLGAERHPGFWAELHRQNVYVIHLHRRNMLRWFISGALAAASGQWIAGTPPQPTNMQVIVDPQAVVHETLRDWRNERQARRFFADHPSLHVWYEDLVDNFDGQMFAIQEFIGVRAKRVRPQCYKQQTRPLSEVIDNYVELYKLWEGTPWQAFLEDETRLAVAPERSRD